MTSGKGYEDKTWYKIKVQMWTMKDMETMLWTKQRMTTWLDDDMAKNNKAKDNDMKNTHVVIARTMKDMSLDGKGD